LFYDVKSDIVLITTVDCIKNTLLKYSHADKALSIQDIKGYPNTKDFIKYVEGNMLPDCPIKKANILHTDEILGPNLGSLKAKTTRTTPSKVQIDTLDDLPTELLVVECHRNVMLAIYIMYINNIISFMIGT